MINYKKRIKVISPIFFVIIFIFFSTLNLYSLEKFNKAKNISDYFAGILLLNESKYSESFKFLKTLNGLESSHLTYSTKYLYTLINSGNFNQALAFSKKNEREQRDNFESDLIIGIYYLKMSKYEFAEKYFIKAKTRGSRSILDGYLIDSLYLLSKLKKNNLKESIFILNKFDKRFDNLNKIQKVFINCYFESNNTEQLFNELISDQKTDFSRYNFFYSKYLESIGENKKAKMIVTSALKKYPRNILLNQYKNYFKNSKNNLNFNCKKVEHIAAELLYITSNALSSQSIFPLSNFYLNLSKYLNKNFKAFDTLLAENFLQIDNYSKAKKIYEKLSKNGNVFKWYASKQISRILIIEEDKARSIKLFKNSYNDLEVKGIYDTYDFAEFLKNNEEFEESIYYYTNILSKIDNEHPLYPKVTDGRGVAYERTDQWEKAEKDLLASLKVKPDQAYVINYLAYSWIEQGVKIEKSLNMLEKANKIKSNDPFIIDSLGWALFKLERFQESKDYLQQAVRLMPADPIVNDHYGDVLWKNGNEIQARYYWSYVLNLEKAEKDLKEKIEQKLIKGL